MVRGKNMATTGLRLPSGMMARILSSGSGETAKTGGGEKVERSSAASMVNDMKMITQGVRHLVNHPVGRRTWILSLISRRQHGLQTASGHNAAMGFA